MKFILKNDMKYDFDTQKALAIETEIYSEYIFWIGNFKSNKSVNRLYLEDSKYPIQQFGTLKKDKDSDFKYIFTNSITNDTSDIIFKINEKMYIPGTYYYFIIS
jgi:hypothetical protein